MSARASRSAAPTLTLTLTLTLTPNPNPNPDQVQDLGTLAPRLQGASYACVLDGHGGSRAADFGAAELHRRMAADEGLRLDADKVGYLLAHEALTLPLPLPLPPTLTRTSCCSSAPSTG